MKFSVIVPVYNVQAYLSQYVENILEQDYENFELILIDDGSPDNCPTLCDDYAEKDCRVSVIHKENGGLSDARNAGILAADGALHRLQHPFVASVGSSFRTARDRRHARAGRGRAGLV